MVWEQSSVVLVCLQRPDELVAIDSVADLTDDAPVSYWPPTGTQQFGNFEVGPFGAVCGGTARHKLYSIWYIGFER